MTKFVLELLIKCAITSYLHIFSKITSNYIILKYALLPIQLYIEFFFSQLLVVDY